ncbi:hypothetical protein GCM10020219_032790 [Nonomuraea dietziae]
MRSTPAWRRGWAGLRVSGEMSWALAGQPGTDQLEDFERRVTGVYAVGRAVGLCQYDARCSRPSG